MVADPSFNCHPGRIMGCGHTYCVRVPLPVAGIEFCLLGTGLPFHCIPDRQKFLGPRHAGIAAVGLRSHFLGAAGSVGVAVGLFGAAGQFDANFLITFHNICVWFSALCHLTGVTLTLRPRPAMRATGLWLAAAYTITIGVVGMVMLSVLAGWTPTFFVQGQGGTLLRYLVLGSATAMFGLTAVLLMVANRGRLSAFKYWYALALALITVGLFGIMIETVHASPLSWAGRGAVP